MSTYHTKCGRTFEKSSKAETTGYHLPEDESGKIIDTECAACPFVVDVTEGWGEEMTHKRYECRAGNQEPNHENEWHGSLDDKNTLSILSLDHEFCEAVIRFGKEHPDLYAQYTQDRNDCRRAISVGCSGNRKGMAAKKELVEKFFPEQEPEPKEETASEYKAKCPYLSSIGQDCIRCSTGSKLENPRWRKEFGSEAETKHYTDQHCFDSFHLCEKYIEFYYWDDPDLSCMKCCHNSWHRDLPEGYSGSEYGFCQLTREPRHRSKDDICGWFNRHLDWPLGAEAPTDVRIQPAPETLDLTEPAQAQVFDYSAIDQDTADTLQEIENRIARIRAQTVYEIGEQLSEANERLAKKGYGIFGVWCESIGFSRQSAQNYMQAYEFVCQNFDKPDDAIGIQSSLLFAAAKPSAPAELAQAVVEGDITKHKEYQEALSRLKETEKEKEEVEQAKREAEKSRQEADEDISRLQKALEDQKKNYRDLKSVMVVDAEKIKALEESLAEKEKELEETNQAPTEPIEAVVTIETREVIPEAVQKGWCGSITSALDTLYNLTAEDIALFDRITGDLPYLEETVQVVAERIEEIGEEDQNDGETT